MNLLYIHAFSTNQIIEKKIIDCIIVERETVHHILICNR